MGQQRTTFAGVEAFLEQAGALQDEDRLALAEARSGVDETFHAGAWRAASTVAIERAEEYLEGLARMGSAFVPERLHELVALGAEADAADVERWQGVARLARVAMEDALLAFVGADLLRPPDLRELCGPWQAMLRAAHERAAGADAS